MTTLAPAPEAAAAPAPRQPRRWGRWVGLVLALLVAACVGWLWHLAHAAGAQMAGARSDIAKLRTGAGTLTADQAAALEKDLQTRTGDVHRSTENPLWKLASHVPDFGADFRVAGGMAAITDSLSHTVLPELLDSSRGLRPETLRRADGSIDLAALANVRSATADALPALAAARKQLAGLTGRVHVNGLAATRDSLGTELASIQTTLGIADTALTLMPPMLGGSGTRHYFVVFQNLAEARGTGGLMGTWGVLTAKDGELTLDQTGPVDAIRDNGKMTAATVEPGAGFGDTWDLYDPLASYDTANLSPDFAAAGSLFAQHASAELGIPFDGVLALDPVTLGLLLGKQQVTLSDGTVVNGGNAATVTESSLYVKYGEQSPVRKQLLAELASDAFKAIRNDSGGDLLSVLKTAIGGGHLQLWSSHPAEEAALAGTDLGGVLPSGPGSFAYVDVDNTGPKTDFWLHRSIFYTAGACPAKSDPDQTRESEIVLTLTDEVPPGQADVVAHDASDPSAPYGRGHDLVSVYGPVGADYESATLNGKPVDVDTSVEKGHLVMQVDLFEPDGVAQNLIFKFQEPASSKVVTWRQQPMGQPAQVVTRVAPCS